MHTRNESYEKKRQAQDARDCIKQFLMEELTMKEEDVEDALCMLSAFISVDNVAQFAALLG